MWRCFLRHKVVLSCGQAFSCSTPGWFRMVFAVQQPHLQVGECVLNPSPTTFLLAVLLAEDPERSQSTLLYWE